MRASNIKNKKFSGPASVQSILKVPEQLEIQENPSHKFIQDFMEISKLLGVTWVRKKSDNQIWPI